MFVDASVIVAILGREPGWLEIVKRLDSHKDGFFISPLVRYEAVHGLARQKIEKIAGKAAKRKPTPELVEQAEKAVETFIAGLGADEIAISPAMGTVALDASKTYGKAVGNPADLNFGDCFAYACAKALNVPLAYKGNDFALTDLA